MIKLASTISVSGKTCKRLYKASYPISENEQGFYFYALMMVR